MEATRTPTATSPLLVAVRPLSNHRELQKDALGGGYGVGEIASHSRGQAGQPVSFHFFFFFLFFFFSGGEKRKQQTIRVCNSR